MKPKPHTVRTLIAAVLSLALGGCFSAVVGGAAVGAKSVIDRRTTGAQTDDNVMALRIETTARSYLRQNNQTKGYTPQISVVGYNRHLLLLGQVATEGEKQFVGQIARSEQAAEGVYNYITVASLPRTAGDIAGDTWNTSKVRATLLGISPATQARVKIITYGNVTYVMGILTPEEQAQITQKSAPPSAYKKSLPSTKTTSNADSAMPFEPPSDGIARHPKSTIKMAKKPNKPFRLTPKLLIRAVLLICITAIGALAVGIVSTFNPNGDKTLQTEPQHTDSPRETEFWLPNGAVGQDAAQPEHHHAASSEPAQPDGTEESGSGLPPLPHPRKTGSNRALRMRPGQPIR